MDGVIPLLLAAIFWIATHNGFAGTDIRARLVGKIGEVGFRVAYGITSILAIMLLVRAWEGAVAMPIWTAPAWLRLILAAIMLPAFLFFVAGFLRNPTAVGGEGIVALPTFICAPAVARGELVPILSDWPLPELGLHLVYPSRRYLSAKVRTLLEFLGESISDPPAWEAPLAPHKVAPTRPRSGSA